jgi:hypothetical protein
MLLYCKQKHLVPFIHRTQCSVDKLPFMFELLTSSCFYIFPLPMFMACTYFMGVGTGFFPSVIAKSVRYERNELGKKERWEASVTIMTTNLQEMRKEHISKISIYSQLVFVISLHCHRFLRNHHPSSQRSLTVITTLPCCIDADCTQLIEDIKDNLHTFMYLRNCCADGVKPLFVCYCGIGNLPPFCNKEFTLLLG